MGIGGLVNREAHAIRRRRVAKELFMKPSRHAVARKLYPDARGPLLLRIKNGPYDSSKGRCIYREANIALPITNFNDTCAIRFSVHVYEERVFGRPVTRLAPSFQRPTFLRASIRSNRFITLRFFTFLFDFPKLEWRDIKRPTISWE